MKIDNPKPSDIIDPVCGMRIDPQHAADWVCHAGEKIYFCTPGCKQTFESDPKRYLNQKPKRKGFWQRYLDRLNKATGGQTPSCH